jgi:hypothetical protein
MLSPLAPVDISQMWVTEVSKNEEHNTSPAGKGPKKWPLKRAADEEDEDDNGKFSLTNNQ